MMSSRKTPFAAIAIALSFLFGVQTASSQDLLFQNAALEAGLQGVTNGLDYGIAPADFDNDGDLDFFVVSHPENKLFVNNGDGTFEESAEAAGVADHAFLGFGAAWGDYNGDGWLDLYVCNQAHAGEGHDHGHDHNSNQFAPASSAGVRQESDHEPLLNRLFHNNGDGTFTEVAADAGVTGIEVEAEEHHEDGHDHQQLPAQDDDHGHDHSHPSGGAMSAAWMDYDKDGHVDLLVSSRERGALLYRNLGDGHFEYVSHQAGLKPEEEHHEEGHHHDEQTPSQDHDHEHEEESYVRLMFSDWENGHVKLLDPNHDEVVATYDMETQSGFYVYSSSDKRYGYVIQTGADQVNVIDSGIWEEDHFDHMHPYAEEPSMLPFMLEGTTPIHFVSHHGQSAIFFDGEGTATLVNENEFPEPSTSVFASPQAHHGVAVPMQDRMLISSLGEEDSRPQGVDVFDMDGTLLQSFPDEAPGLHGETVLGNKIAFGASNGVLVLERVGDEYESSFIPNPSDAPDGRVGVFASHPSLPHIIGNFNREYVVLIDLDELSMDLVELPSPFVDFTIDAEGEYIVTISTDGNAHVFNAIDGNYKGAIQVMEPFSVDVPRGTPLPSIQAAWHSTLFVSDPNHGHIYSINVESMSVSQEYHVGGAPTNLTVLGLTHYQDEENPVSHEEMDYGVEHAAWADFDGDGFMDVFLSVAVMIEEEHAHEEEHHEEQGTPAQDHDHDHEEEHNAALTENRFFRNNGDGTFTDVTEAMHMGDPNEAITNSAVWGDYNNDGFMDLFVTNRGSENEGTAADPRLYRNNGDGSMTEVAEAVGLAGEIYLIGANWADLDNDGFLDLVAINHPSHADFAAGEFYDKPHPIFMNNGDGTFTNINADSTAAILDTGVTDINHLIGLACADLDGDGDKDILMSENHGDAPFLYYRNEQAAADNQSLEVALEQSGPNPYALGARIECMTAGGMQVRQVGATSAGFASQGTYAQHVGLAGAESADVKVIWPDGTAELYTNLAAGESHQLVKGQGESTSVTNWSVHE